MELALANISIPIAANCSSSEEEVMTGVLGWTTGHKAFIAKQLRDSSKRFMVIEQVAYGKQMKHRLWLIGSPEAHNLKTLQKMHLKSFS